MKKQKILFIGGSINQTTQLHKISEHLSEYDCYFTPFYASGYLRFLTKIGILDFTIMGGKFKNDTIAYLNEHRLKLDFEGKNNDYDLVFTSQDLIVPKNIRNKKLILVQEGMTDPESFLFKIVKTFRLPRWLASTSMTGLSDYYTLFCVASEGYRELFSSKGIKAEKIRVTGIPNFDNCKQFINSDSTYKNFVIVATSDSRETFNYENRKALILKAVEVAKSRQVIFKLHPNENVDRATKEIEKYAPNAIVLHGIPIEPLVANCDVLVTRFSSVSYVAMALGKEVVSDIPNSELKKLAPIQNDGKSAANIAEIAKELLSEVKTSNVFVLQNPKAELSKLLVKVKEILKFVKN